MRLSYKNLPTLAFVMTTALVNGAWADIQVPADMNMQVPTDFATTFTELSTDTTYAAMSDNLTILPAKINV